MHEIGEPARWRIMRRRRAVALVGDVVHRVLNFGHEDRGSPRASARAPENTMAAFELAARLGADGIEFDVQSTIDGELVVLHDMTLERTTTGHGAVHEARWSEMKDVDAGSWFSPEFARAGIRWPRSG